MAQGTLLVILILTSCTCGHPDVPGGPVGIPASPPPVSACAGRASSCWRRGLWHSPVCAVAPAGHGDALSSPCVVRGLCPGTCHKWGDTWGDMEEWGAPSPMGSTPQPCWVLGAAVWGPDPVPNRDGGQCPKVGCSRSPHGTRAAAAAVPVGTATPWRRSRFGVPAAVEQGGCSPPPADTVGWWLGVPPARACPGAGRAGEPVRQVLRALPAHTALPASPPCCHRPGLLWGWDPLGPPGTWGVTRHRVADPRIGPNGCSPPNAGCGGPAAVPVPARGCAGGTREGLGTLVHCKEGQGTEWGDKGLSQPCGTMSSTCKIPPAWRACGTATSAVGTGHQHRRAPCPRAGVTVRDSLDQTGHSWRARPGDPQPLLPPWAQRVRHKAPHRPVPASAPRAALAPSRSPAERAGAWRDQPARGTWLCHAPPDARPCVPAGPHAAGTARHVTAAFAPGRGLDGSSSSPNLAAGDVRSRGEPGCPRTRKHLRFVTSSAASGRPHLPRTAVPRLFTA